MTEGEWLTGTGHSQGMVWALHRMGKVWRTKAGKRKLRLFACGCCRLIWDVLTDPRLRQAVEVAERFADGEAGKDELQAASQSSHGLTMGGYNPGDPGVEAWTAAYLAWSTTDHRAFAAAFNMTAMQLPLAGYDIGGKPGEAVLCELLRCVFGNPFRPVAVERSWLTWNGGTIPRLARAIDAERRFQDLPVLADALEDAGCTTPAILTHCRQPGDHTRGCWVVDLLAGKG